MVTATIYLIDEINCKIDGVTSGHIHQLRRATGKTVKGAFMRAEFKLGIWDGKESQLDEDGFTYLYLLRELLPLLAGLGYQVEYVDYRKPHALPAETVSAALMSDVGVTLRDYQVDAINAVVAQRKGIVRVATSGGKTLICTGLLRYYHTQRSLTIVPSEELVQQTAEQYVECGLDVGRITGKVQGKKRQKMWACQHIVITYQTLGRMKKRDFSDFGVILYDECHVFGDSMFDAMKYQLATAPIRIGLTGTPPKDTHKLEKIMCRLGGEVICHVSPKRLMDEGRISSVHIHTHEIHHDIDLCDPEQTWDSEYAYMLRNMDRISAIADFVRPLPAENTLILCHAETGRRLSMLLGTDFIDQEATAEYRQQCFARYDERSDYRLVATYGTVGTGISINDIYQLVMIDVGKNETAFIQGIGRVMRLDSAGRHHATVYDLYSSLKHSLKHKSKRMKTYRQYQYQYSEGMRIFV